MPFHWPSLPPESDRKARATHTQTPQQASNSQPYTLVVSSDSVKTNIADETTEFTGTVVATYGPTTVKANHAKAWNRENRAVLDGAVQVDDPEGQLTASRFEFLWEARSGTGENVRARIDGIEIRAKSVHIQPGRWEFLDVVAGDPTSGHAVYDLRSPRIVIRPGIDAVISQPKVDLLGRSFGRLPSQRLSLVRGAPGLQLPSIGYRRGRDFGVSWQYGRLVDARTFVDGSFSSYQRARPAYAASIYRSVLRASDATAHFVVPSEFDEKFAFSWFENSNVRNPADEPTFLNRPRATVGLGSDWNHVAFTRWGDEQINKPFEAEFQGGGHLGQFGYVGEARLQSIGLAGEELHRRLILSGSVGPSLLKIAPRLGADFRIDGFDFEQGSSRYRWIHGQFGLVYRPQPFMTVGLAYIATAQSGTALFLTDRPDATSALHARAEVTIGPRRFGMLGKYDVRQGKWFDREYSFAQKMGNFELYVVKRQFPDSLRFGITVRLDRILDALSRRNVQRPLGNPADGLGR